MINESNEELTEEENDSDLSSESNESLNSHSTTFIQSISNDSIVELPEKDKTNDYVRELKAEVHRHYQLNWLEKFEPWKHNPKIELNVMIFDSTKHLASMKESLFQHDDCTVQRIFQHLIHHQRNQRIIYTEILFRPELFELQPKTSHHDLQRMMEILIGCIRISTNIKSEQTKDSSFLSYITEPLPSHVKIILSCRWNQVEWFPEFIQLAREYPDEIVGIDLYGSAEECRNHWKTFLPYRKLSQQYQLTWQANIIDCTDQQLLLDVIEGLHVQRLLETYDCFQSRKSIHNILVKYGIHLIVCPTSPSTFIDHLQSEHVNYSISSLSLTQDQQNLVKIYQDLLDLKLHTFTCEHMQWLNENALKNSFATQKLKTTLMNYLRENYANCYQQTLLLQQFEASTKKWEQEMGNIIDTNVRTAMDLAKKMQKENLLPPKPDEVRFDPELMGDAEDDGEEEEEEIDQVEE